MFDRLNGPQAQSQTRRIVHLTRPTDKRVGKRGDALRARSEASMIARLRVARPSAAPVPKSDAELIAEVIAAGKVRHIPRGISGLPEFAPSAEPMEPET